MVCSDADNGWSRCKSFTNTEALDHYSMSVAVCIHWQLGAVVFIYLYIVGPCFHWRTFAINNLQWLLLLRPHDTFN
jgi:hypothetical protein